MPKSTQSTSGDTMLSKHELNQIWYRWGFTHLSSMSYEKLQAHAWAYSYIPFADKYYKDDEDGKRRLLVRHSMFYNTEPQTGQLINGIVASLEEQIAMGRNVSEEMPVNIKATLMGPLAGIGDSIIQGIIVPILLSIAMSLAKGGSPLGPMFYIIAYGIIGPTISYIAFHSGYRLGVNAIDVIVGENSKRITDAFNILGIMVVGALAANTIVLKTIAKIPLGGKSAPLENVLTGIFPDLLPLAMVMFAWWLISAKQMSATKVILIITAIVTVGCLVGFF
ncbi:PTS system mannose/fructose/sorbose family transporter subunit IID [Lacticaseibacillus casei]|jgi:mannose/fructose/N-acetylgalactosamine-specific phosphotransferase system component IID|uniref:PTS system mannose/fructose/sorbose family transporter subunit IID n=1 Tax=Lacticaseibacillus huelsenbergensis TaxID=3035291 RepID=A0ABY8DR71_9LACO|nr:MULTISPECIES: PTS system mannose/fructose/sorbose family transporter subunit IID [Lacticaseibacillus]MDG3060940.1 PTS system mannose/fructose/sorbose family transporter subunit IID [Lacticaseibacillus sp. BCRC 81376]QXG59070.1 PTS system mannose/fructose/sorbose family transporter subunit IID [Lacticaseibacillus casei]WFB39480.1 PTS system mannose/fructose/sorbose family transporter subunit IID [Lacticaseibacillus huelsenbergensis]WFB41182.1 PTS system mannose/fructose/sorbose family transpo